MIKNPIITGFAPDPSIVRVNEDYYIANSTFEWFPGIRLYHSKDLENWTEIAPPITRSSQLNMLGNPNSSGVWAPDITYKDGIFYIVYSDVKSKQATWYNVHNYIIWASSIEGPWSEPEYLNSIGFDPSLFHDTDGKTWLVSMREGFKGILIQEFDIQTKQLVGPEHFIFKGTEAGYTEGPHIYKRNNYYYLLTAEGGTGYGHQITVARSKSLFGPYQVMPTGPLLTSKDTGSASLQKAGHGDLVQDTQGNWYVAYLCSRPVGGHLKSVLGRESALEKIQWNEDEWPRLAQGGHSPSQAVQKEEVKYTDPFTSGSLDYGWKRLRIPFNDDISLQEKHGWVQLKGRETVFSNFNVSLIARKQEYFNSQVQVDLYFTPEQNEHGAGILYMYDNMHFYLLLKSLNDDNQLTLSLYEYHGQKFNCLAEQYIEDGVMALLVKTNSVQAQFYFKNNGSEPLKIGPKVDVSLLSDEVARGFTGAHFALYCHDRTGKGHPAFFTNFIIDPQINSI